MSGIEAIAAERKRQIESKGWTPEHDDQHTDMSLAKAASSYAWASSAGAALREAFGLNPPPVWPDSWDDAWWKPKSRREDLVRAGALIAAEIDRLDRLEARQKDGA